MSSLLFWQSKRQQPSVCLRIGAGTVVDAAVAELIVVRLADELVDAAVAALLELGLAGGEVPGDGTLLAVGVSVFVSLH